VVKRGDLQWYNDPVGKSIKAAVREAVRIHGPICSLDTKLNSVVKRVYGVVKRLEMGDYDRGRSVAVRRLRQSEKIRRYGLDRLESAD